MIEQELLKALLGAVGGALATWLGLHWKIRHDLMARYDRDLRVRRIKSYVRLWALTEPMARYAPPAPVTAETFRQMAVQLRRWYFHDGGIYLSDPARDAYFAMQTHIADALDAGDAPETALASHARRRSGDTKIETPEDCVRDASSRLRSALVGDVGSRNRPMLEGPRHA